MKSTNDNEIILEVFELKKHIPVLKYRIVVYDKIIISVNNSGIKNGVSKVINEEVKEELIISELTKIEKLNIGNSLTHRFEIRKLGWKNLFLNLSEKELIKLGFKEKPKTFWKRLKKVHKTIIWIAGGTLLLLSIIIALFQTFEYLQKLKTNKESNSKQEVPIRNENNISETDSLNNNLKD